MNIPTKRQLSTIFVVELQGRTGQMDGRTDGACDA